jgi:hypothetical protein
LGPESYLLKGITLNRVEEFRRYAADCRDMARTAPLDQRQKLQQMAQTLEQLAQEFVKRADAEAENDSKGLVIEFNLPKDRPKRP